MLKDWVECPVATIPGVRHPAIYPRALVEDFVNLTTNPGDIVLDPFVGSGTTALASQGLGRHYIGIDLNADYASDARRRLAEQRRQLGIEPRERYPVVPVRSAPSIRAASRRPSPDRGSHDLPTGRAAMPGSSSRGGPPRSGGPTAWQPLGLFQRKYGTTRGPEQVG